jgi:protein-S-isoprenylcysteine O-methyltransferase Ste14
MIAVKSFLHNLAATAVAFLVAFAGRGLDLLFKIEEFRSVPKICIGALLMCLGFLIRFWATYRFYKNRMRVVSTAPQDTLLTSGPYHYSRNPLYLGGNVFMFVGASLMLGSPLALALTVLHLPFVDLFIRREERQLEQRFGEDWVRYKQSVRRWV